MLGTISSLVFGPPPLTREQRYLFFGEGDAPADAPPMRRMLYAHDDEAYVTADEMARCRAWLGGGPRDGLVSEDAAGASVLSAFRYFGKTHDGGASAGGSVGTADCGDDPLLHVAPHDDRGLLTILLNPEDAAAAAAAG